MTTLTQINPIPPSNRVAADPQTGKNVVTPTVSAPSFARVHFDPLMPLSEVVRNVLRLQTNVDLQLRHHQMNPFASCQLITNQTLSGKNVVINHGLGRPWTFAIVGPHYGTAWSGFFIHSTNANDSLFLSGSSGLAPGTSAAYDILVF